MIQIKLFLNTMLYNLNFFLSNIFKSKFFLHGCVLLLKIILCTNFWLLHTLKDLTIIYSFSSNYIPLLKLLSIPFAIIATYIIHVFIKKFDIFKVSYIFLIFNVVPSIILHCIHAMDFNKLSLLFFLYIYIDLWGNIFITFLFWQLVQVITKYSIFTNMESKYFFFYSLGTPIGMLISSFILPGCKSIQFIYMLNIIFSFICIAIIYAIKSYFIVSELTHAINIDNKLLNLKDIKASDILKYNNIIYIIAIGIIINFSYTLSKTRWDVFLSSLNSNVLVKSTSKILFLGGFGSLIMTLFFFYNNKVLENRYFGIIMMLLFFIPNIIFNIYAYTSPLYMFNIYIGILSQMTCKITKDQFFDVYKEISISKLSIKEQVKVKPFMDIVVSKCSKTLCSCTIILLQILYHDIDLTLRSSDFLIMNVLMFIFWIYSFITFSR